MKQHKGKPFHYKSPKVLILPQIKGAAAHDNSQQQRCLGSLPCQTSPSSHDPSMHNFGLALGKKGDFYATARVPRLPHLTDGSLLIVLASQGLRQHVPLSGRYRLLKGGCKTSQTFMGLRGS